MGALLRFDLLRIRNWFRSHVGTKILVFLGFLMVVALVVLVEYLMAWAFFHYTAIQEQFGRAVAQYSINAALLVLFLLAVASSITASAGSLYRPGFLRFLITLPIEGEKLFISRMVTAFFQSTTMIILLLIPVLAAFGQNFGGGLDYVTRSLTVLILLSASSQAVGGMLTITLVQRFGKLTRKGIALVFALVISGSLFLMRFLFPPAFFRLYYAEDWLTFEHSLGQLPLIATNLPTNWLAKTLTIGWSGESLYAILGTALILALAIRIGKSYYIPSFRISQEGSFHAGKDLTKKIWRRDYPKLPTPIGALLMNEILSIIRSPAEGAYAAFLTALTIILLFMMRNVPALKNVVPEFLAAVIAVSLAGLAYLSMTLSARLVYPLIAREKHTSWLLFSIPLKRESLLLTKTLFAVLITLPAIFLGGVGALLMEMPPAITAAYVIILFLTTMSVSLTQLFLGTIAPNFAEADNLEAASTSGSGLTSITISLALIGIAGFLLFGIIHNSMLLGTSLFMLVIIQMILLIPLFLLARRRFRNYDL